MTNSSGLEALGHAVLIRPYEPKVQSSIIAIPDSAQGRMVMAEQRATIVQVGRDAWKEERWFFGLIRRPRAKPGDKVLVTKYAGYQTVGTLDGISYRLVNDRDVFCKITEEKADG
jgi:co-chaperonin GroES (HSP10)